MVKAPLASYVEWIPGNGQCYALHFTLLPEDAFKRIDPTIMIVGPTIRFPNVAALIGAEQDSISLDLVMSKFSLNEKNGIPVTLMIAAVLDRKAIIPDGAMCGYTPWKDLPAFTFTKDPVL